MFLPVNSTKLTGRGHYVNRLMPDQTYSNVQCINSSSGVFKKNVSPLTHIEIDIENIKEVFSVPEASERWDKIGDGVGRLETEVETKKITGSEEWIISNLSSTFSIKYIGCQSYNWKTTVQMVEQYRPLVSNNPGTYYETKCYEGTLKPKSRGEIRLGIGSVGTFHMVNLQANHLGIWVAKVD